MKPALEVPATGLSPLEWLMPRTYVSQIFCFPAQNHQVLDTLRRGLSRLVEDIPYLLSGILDHQHPRGSVQLTDPYQVVDDLISFRDLTSRLDYASLREKKFPPSDLTLPSIKPADTTPPFPCPEPVFRSRLSIVKGGALLCVAVHHNTTDIMGLGALLRLWALHCGSTALADFAFNKAMHDRTPLLGMSLSITGNAPGSLPELIHLGEDTSESRAARAVLQPADYHTRIFSFAQNQLQELKALVNSYLPRLQSSVEWVSTSDVLAAILWSATIWAEQDPEVTTHHGRLCTAGIPVNFRSRTQPPLVKDYLGAAFAMTKVTATHADLVSLSSSATVQQMQLDEKSALVLTRIASSIRASLRFIDNDRIQAGLAHIAAQSDITTIKLGPRHDGISLVSWAEQGIYEFDWGPALGVCEAVRLAQMRGRRNPIVLPKVPSRDGHEAKFEVIASFDKEMMERFCQSKMIQSFATF